MRRFSLFAIGCLLVLGRIMPLAAQSEERTVIRMQGAVSLALPFADSIRTLRNEYDIDLRLTTVGGSVGGIAALGAGDADIALSSRPVTPEERAAAPETIFYETPLAVQAMALVVSRQVWEGGVQALSAEQVRAIYEERVTNWKQVGGPDLKITMFLMTQGRGLWEMCAQWLYEEVRKTPSKDHPVINTFEEMRTAVEFTEGGIGQLPLAQVNGTKAHALAIILPDQTRVEPTFQSIANGTYPLFRKLLAVTNQRPTTNLKRLIDYFFSEKGQQVTREAGLIPVGEIWPNEAALR
jgi:phosphate transport system substrate-binding protein